MSDATGFHAGDGWFFKRLDDETPGPTDWVARGRVEIRTNVSSIIFDKDTWASIVASVSKEGESGSTLKRAEALHDGYNVMEASDA